MKRLALAAVAALIGTAAFVLPTTSVQAADFSVGLTAFVDAPTGSTVDLGTFSTQGFAGQTCEVNANGTNNTSVHLLNDLIVTSVNSVTMLNVERAPGAQTPANGPITLNDNVNISVFIGNQDSGLDGGVWSGIFSGDIVVEFTCSPTQTTSTTTTTTTTTVPEVEIDLCHANPDGSYTLEGPFTPAEAQQLHGDHPNDINPAPEGGCPPPPEVELCHSNSDGSFSLEGPFTPAEAQQLHGDHPNDINPAPAGGCAGVRTVEISLCHTNADDTYSVEGPLTQAEAQRLHGSHAADIIPAPEGGCPAAAEVAVGAIGPVCIADIPFISYEIITNFGATTVDLTITDINGDVVAEYPNAPLIDTIIYPGASADPEDWPGWRLAENGNWEPDPSDAHLREGLLVTATINPSGSATVSYPPATEACADPPTNRTSDDPPAGSGGGGGGDASSGTPTGGLPVTGSGNTVGLLLAALALIAGGFLLIRSTRTDDTATDTPTD
jgi:hypothetical protein